MPAIGISKALLEDDIPVLIITERKPEGVNTGLDTDTWCGLSRNDGRDSIKSAIPVILQVSNGTFNETSLTTRDFVTTQMGGPYCRVVASTVAKSGSVYWNGSKAVPVRQSRIEGSLQEFVLAYLRAPVIYISHYGVLARHPGQRVL